jgi:phospholipid N-methyltransferase
MNSENPAVEIRLKQPVKLPRYARYLKKKRILSRKDREIEVFFGGEKLFSALVPKTVFNPYVGDPNAETDAKFLVESILTRSIDVKGKRVVDLGCGCGIIGLSCIQAGAKSIVFTDINPNIQPLKNNGLLRKTDTVKVQDLLSEENEDSYDVVIMSVPMMQFAGEGEKIDAESYMTGIIHDRKIIARILRQASKVLTKGGVLVLAASVVMETAKPCCDLMMTLDRFFDFRSLRILRYSKPESPLVSLLRLISKRYLFYGAAVCPNRTSRIYFTIAK